MKMPFIHRTTGKAPDTRVAPDHKLILSVINEMTRINRNLAFMDTNVKGVSQLKNRACAIMRIFSENGYEVPELVGTEYREGMNMDAAMEEDESLAPGRSVIKRVVRPMVLYRGEMIQAPSVVVACHEE